MYSCHELSGLHCVQIDCTRTNCHRFRTSKTIEIHLWTCSSHHLFVSAIDSFDLVWIYYDVNDAPVWTLFCGMPLLWFAWCPHRSEWGGGSIYIVRGLQIHLWIHCGDMDSDFALNSVVRNCLPRNLGNRNSPRQGQYFWSLHGFLQQQNIYIRSGAENPQLYNLNFNVTQWFPGDVGRIPELLFRSVSLHWARCLLRPYDAESLEIIGEIHIVSFNTQVIPFCRWWWWWWWRRFPFAGIIQCFFTGDGTTQNKLPSFQLFGRMISSVGSKGLVNEVFFTRKKDWRNTSIRLLSFLSSCFHHWIPLLPPTTRETPT